MENQFEGFEFEGTWITDPFMDETGRFEVDPKEYYGIEITNNIAPLGAL